MRCCLPILLLTALAVPASAQPQHIAPTEARTPAEQQKGFKVPDGFAVQLVAAEPQIDKPIQIAFDARGRLWATTSRHYPFPAPEGEAGDKLYVLSDFGPDGKAAKVQVFADDLNIPIGVLPLPDGNSCIVSEAGRVLKLTDSTGDGKADKKEVLLKGFEFVDTHGMTNSFLLLPDGWVYATHGFRNNSEVVGTDGSKIRMQSGNTYRFRPDGSRLQHWTFGQVNPFGLTFDPYLNLYTADCHSKPITQLIRDGYYQSFGKPHDGLGFAPHVTDHQHGSTALCGLAWYEADHFPKEFQGRMFLGNVVTSRVNADKIVWKGSTPVAEEVPDFVVSEDPWFRPTDIQLGPDGALYIADFYNRIIGHYEVDLKHPLRDKERGRIWRVVWTGEDGKAPPPEMPFEDLTKLDLEQVGGQLISPNLVVRVMAANELASRFVAEPNSQLPNVGGLGGDQLRLASTMVGLGQMAADQAGVVGVSNEVFATLLQEMKKREEEEQLQLTGMLVRALASRQDWTAVERGLAVEAAGSVNPHMKRAAVDGMIGHPHSDFILSLIELIDDCPSEDTHLLHAARVALRNALRATDDWPEFATWTDEEAAILADAALGLPTTDSAKFLTGRVKAGRHEPRFCELIARHGDDEQLLTVAQSVGGEPASLPAFLAMARGLQARNKPFPAEVKKLAVQEADQALASTDSAAHTTAGELAVVGRLTELFPKLAGIAADPKQPEPSRLGVMNSLIGLDAAKGVATVQSVLADSRSALPIRQRSAELLGNVNRPEARQALLEAFATAPYRLAVVVGTSLANSPDGSVALLDAVSQGKAPASLLQERGIVDRIGRHQGGQLTGRVKELTKNIPSTDARLAKLMQARAAGYHKQDKWDAELGKKLFTQNCANCHQIGNEGNKVGPQLDGIGNRGLERLLEDVLDPSRHVDEAFRTTVLDLADGRTLTGLLLREEGEVLIMADDKGKELRVPMADVEKRTVSPASPMPSNFDTAISEADFYQLMRYLLQQRADE